MHNLTTDSCEYTQNVDNSHSTDIGDTWNVGNTHNTHSGEEGNLDNSHNTQIVVMIASGHYSQHVLTTCTHTHSGEDRQMDTTQHIAGLEVKETRVETLVVPQKLKVVSNQLQTAPMEQSYSGKTMQCID